MATKRITLDLPEILDSATAEIALEVMLEQGIIHLRGDALNGDPVAMSSIDCLVAWQNVFHAAGLISLAEDPKRRS